MILLDFSGISIAPIASGRVAYDDENFIRHTILNTIRMYRQKFRKYGGMVIVADYGGNWRRDVYPEYKCKRSKTRAASKIDWNVAFENITKVLDEIREHMPYHVIQQWGCEADDSIAELTKYTQDFGNWEEVMIVSADKDFIQLQKYGNVEQYSTLTKKFMKHPNPRLYQQGHILSGDSGDGVPNVLSDDKTFFEERRQVTLTAKKKAILMENPQALGEEVYANYLRNKKMIVLTEESECPDSVKKEIINSYVIQNPAEKRTKVLPYLIEKRCKLLMECVQEFL